jgi:dTDP-4-amino-4,6-dideoxygalactose transaminase
MIQIFNYKKFLESHYDEVISGIKRVLDSGKLILGPQTEQFEQNFADFTDSAHCIGVTSGTMALELALRALGVEHGSEVITVSNTCTPTISAIQTVGAIPVFVDICEDSLLMDVGGIEELITEKTKAIIAVHLWGHSIDIDSLLEISRIYNLHLIEDCAQAACTTYRGKQVGTYGAVGCFSFYPTKNLGAYGDAGAVITDDLELGERIRMMRTYGYDSRNISQFSGTNGRISEIQAAILNIKLNYLAGWVEKRRENASIYFNEVKNENIVLPARDLFGKDSYHQFGLRVSKRDVLISQLQSHGIEYGIHYPVPVHKMPGYFKNYELMTPLPVTERVADRIISIPVQEYLSNNEVEKIVNVINRH